MAAYRTLSVDHPVFGVLNRRKSRRRNTSLLAANIVVSVAYEVFAIQPIAEVSMISRNPSTPNHSNGAHLENSLPARRRS